MKNLKILFIVLAVLSLSSCKLRYRQGDYPLEFNKTISGLSEYYEVTNAYLRISKESTSKMFVEVKKTLPGLPFDPFKIEEFQSGLLSESVLYNTWTIRSDIFGENDLPFFPNCTLIALGRFLIIEPGETCWIEFDIGKELNSKPKMAKKVRLNFYLNL